MDDEIVCGESGVSWRVSLVSAFAVVLASSFLSTSIPKLLSNQNFVDLTVSETMVRVVSFVMSIGFQTLPVTSWLLERDKINFVCVFIPMVQLNFCRCRESPDLNDLFPWLNVILEVSDKLPTVKLKSVCAVAVNVKKIKQSGVRNFMVLVLLDYLHFLV